MNNVERKLANVERKLAIENSIFVNRNGSADQSLNRAERIVMSVLIRGGIFIDGPKRPAEQIQFRQSKSHMAWLCDMKYQQLGHALRGIVSKLGPHRVNVLGWGYPPAKMDQPELDDRGRLVITIDATYWE